MKLSEETVMQRTAALLISLLAIGSVFAQGVPVTVRVPADTLFVIPAGPVAGSFTSAARLTVVDTVAGWAKIQLEGWVPIPTVLGRMNQSGISPQIQPKAGKSDKDAPSTPQCEGITKKGTRCKRAASPGSRFCWQHQQ